MNYEKKFVNPSRIIQKLQKTEHAYNVKESQKLIDPDTIYSIKWKTLLKQFTGKK